MHCKVSTGCNQRHLIMTCRLHCFLSKMVCLLELFPSLEADLQTGAIVVADKSHSMHQKCSAKCNARFPNANHTGRISVLCHHSVAVFSVKLVECAAMKQKKCSMNFVIEVP